jgi:hypothetical protein
VFSLPVLKHHVILSFLFQKFSFLFELSHINNTREPCNPNYAGAEIRRILVWSQSEPIVCETLSWKYPIQKQTGVVQGVGPEFKPQHSKKKKKKKRFHCDKSIHAYNEPWTNSPLIIFPFPLPLQPLFSLT